jgi:PAS domain S-box-containing protein
MLPIRQLVPAIFLLASLLGGAIVALFGRHAAAGSAERAAREIVLDKLIERQLVIEYTLRARDHDKTREIVAELATDVAIDFAVLVGPNREVVASTRQALVGRPLDDAIRTIGWPLAVLEAGGAETRSTQSPALQRLEERASVVGQLAIADATGEGLTHDASATLIVEYAYGPKAAAFAQQAYRSAAVFVVATLALGAAVSLALQLSMRRRMARLLGAAEEVAGGRFEVRAGVTGRDEIGAIGAAFDAMAARLETAAAAREESEERYRGVFEQASLAIFVVGPGGRFEVVNDAACALSGWSRTELTTRGPEEIVVVEASPRASIASLDDARPGTSLVRADGERVPVELVERTLGNERRMLLGRDLRPEREAIRLRERLIAADRLAAIGTLAASVGHEINNPLTFILTNLQLLRDDVAALRAKAEVDELVQMIEEAEEGAHRIERIVADLRMFARQKRDETPTPFDLRDAARSALGLAAPSLRDKVQVVERFDEVPPVVGDPRRLGQVVLNILLNAAQAITAANRRGRVELSIGTDGAGRARITIEDDGPGIPPDVLPRIFDPFFTTKPVGEGTGLGLAISREIVAGMGGELQVESEAGQGAKFTIALPAAAVGSMPAPAARTSRSSAPPPGDEAAGRARARIGTLGSVLLVDDEPLLAASLARALDAFEVAVAHDPAAALAQCRARAFDAIVCDVVMPGGGGRAVLEGLRAERPELASRLVFLTGGIHSAEEAAYFEQSGAPILDKPVDVPALRAALAQAVRRRDALPVG